MASERLIRLAPVLEIVQTAIWTARVEGEKPVSLILIADQESAKSQVLLAFQGTETLNFFSDLTSRGFQPIQADIERGRIRHLVLLDLVRIVSHGRSVSDRAIQTIAGYMEEGEAASADAGGLHAVHGMPQVGVLTSITPDYFKAKRGQWRKTGFLTRFLPVYFHYHERTTSRIHVKIRDGHKLSAPRPELLPEVAVSITLPKVVAEKIMQTASDWGLQNTTYGFRYHRQLRAMVQAHALMNGRKVVSDNDVETVLGWREFFSSSQPHIL